MVAAFTISPMGKARGRGRPQNPDKKTESSLNVAIPTWVKKLALQSAHKEGRHLKIEIARRLKIAFGYAPDAEKPEEPKKE